VKMLLEFQSSAFDRSATSPLLHLNENNVLRDAKFYSIMLNDAQ
jgi:hypothetical protein